MSDAARHPLLDTTQERKSKQVKAVIMNTTISSLVGEVYQKLSKVKSSYNEWIFTGGCLCALKHSQTMPVFLFSFVFLFKKRCFAYVGLLSILSFSTRGSIKSM